MLAFVYVAPAQNVSITQSECTPWSGGIAGRSGCNYLFTIAFSYRHVLPIPDTLWIEDNGIALTSGDHGNMKVLEKDKRHIVYRISAQTSRDHGGVMPMNTKHAGAHPKIPTGTVGVLSYRCASKHHYFPINAIQTWHPAINYP
jgi:hypothetical protein